MSKNGGVEGMHGALVVIFCTWGFFFGGDFKERRYDGFIVIWLFVCVFLIVDF